ncbi:MAG: FAD-dependent oxidoreductase [Alphaproteobacteria bacterium]|nr:FAD-dependent oxidoreductase [Alphaproteobacteria bacterium]MBV8409208.1 FAD-dependent oxidoreductase [Alphaproteobacteria bacterium]
MNTEQERSRSLWMEVPALDFPSLASDQNADVLVIGAGIAGLSAAYELASLRRGVIVVDRGRIGRGMSARTSAHLAFEIDDFYHELILSHGIEAARSWYRSQSAAVDRIESVCRAEEIDCDFKRVDGLLFAAREDDVEYLRKELDAARSAGLSDAEWVDAGRIVGGDRPAIRFPRQARFHPVKYLNGLAAALQRLGAKLYASTAIQSLEERDDQIVARTEAGHAIRARQVVVATNSPFHLRIPIHTKQAPYRTYVIAAPVPKGTVDDVLLWDTGEPAYHYVRVQPGRSDDVLIVGGEDHKSGVVPDGAAAIARLEAWARQHWPQMGPITHAWSGQVLEPADLVGFAGRSPRYDHVYLVSGDSGEGLTTGVAAAMLVRDLAMSSTSPWTALYEPSRQMHRGLAEYLKENLDAVRHWAELLGRGDVDSLDEIAPAQGARLKLGGQQVAAYRDETGGLHVRSAVCTHAGCALHWNAFERCWDCPCHGSQFGVDGEVLNGPAAQPLAEVDIVQLAGATPDARPQSRTVPPNGAHSKRGE